MDAYYACKQGDVETVQIYFRTCKKNSKSINEFLTSAVFESFEDSKHSKLVLWFIQHFQQTREFLPQVFIESVFLHCDVFAIQECANYIFKGKSMDNFNSFDHMRHLLCRSFALSVDEFRSIFELSTTNIWIELCQLENLITTTPSCDQDRQRLFSWILQHVSRLNIEKTKYLLFYCD